MLWVRRCSAARKVQYTLQNVCVGVCVEKGKHSALPLHQARILTQYAYVSNNFRACLLATIAKRI